MTRGSPPLGRTTANSRQRRPVRQTAHRRPARSIAARSSALNVFTLLKIDVPSPEPAPLPSGSWLNQNSDALTHRVRDALTHRVRNI
jgi:hypothetical protein